jgi:ABC-type transporter Mla subunit MlaD
MVSVADINAMTGELRTQLSVEEQRTLLSKLHLMLDDLNATTTSVREQLQAGNGAGLIAKLHAALDVVHQDLTELLGTLTENRPLVNSALASIEHTTRVLDEQMLARLQAELNRDNPDSLLSKLHAGMDHLNAAVADLEVVSETGKRMLVLSRPQVERIIANVEDMSAVLTQTSKDIQLNPARLIWGPARPTESKIAVLTAARDFAQAATYLNDTAARLQAILAAGPEGRQVSESDAEVREIYESLRSAFERWQRAETFFWDQMK